MHTTRKRDMYTNITFIVDFVTLQWSYFLICKTQNTPKKSHGAEMCGNRLRMWIAHLATFAQVCQKTSGGLGSVVEIHGYLFIFIISLKFWTMSSYKVGTKITQVYGYVWKLTVTHV